MGNTKHDGPCFLHLVFRALEPRFLTPNENSLGWPAIQPPEDSFFESLFQGAVGDEMYAMLGKDGNLLNCRDHHGRACLHVAIEAFDVPAVDILLREGADRNIQDNKGRTPLQRARELFRDTKDWRGGGFDLVEAHLNEIIRLLEE